VKNITSCLLKPGLYTELIIYASNLSPCLVQNRQGRVP